MKKLFLILSMFALVLVGCGESDTIPCTNCGEEVVIPAPEPEVVLPCPDTRDGIYNISYEQLECNSHGYFYCTIANDCLNKPINVNSCGEIGSEQREAINNGV